MPRKLILALCILTSCKEQSIFHSKQEREVSSAALLLSESGIDATVRRIGDEWSVAVDEQNRTQAGRILLEEEAVIHRTERPPESLGGLIPSREERAHLAERQRAWEIEQTIGNIPGVRKSAVHLFDPSMPAGPAEKKIRTASVLVVADTVIDEGQIKAIVSGAAGLESAAVQVVILERKNVPPVTLSVGGPKESGEKSSEKSSGIIAHSLQSVMIIGGLIVLVLLLIKKRIVSKLKKKSTSQLLEPSFVDRDHLDKLTNSSVVNSHSVTNSQLMELR